MIGPSERHAGAAPGLLPLASALGLLGLWYSVTFALCALWLTRDDLGFAALLSTGIAAPFAAGAALLLAAAWLPGWRGVTGLARPASRGTLHLGLPIFLHFGCFALLASLAGLPPVSVVVFLLLNMALIGLSEELMFRGFLLEGLRAAFGLRRAVILSSLAFGLVHVPNGLLSGLHDVALAQAVAAFLTGLFFVAVRVRTGALWPCIVLHALWNFGTALLVMGSVSGSSHPALSRPEPEALAGPILLALPLAIYALRLLRDTGRAVPGAKPALV